MNIEQRRRGQSTIEYAFAAALVVAAVLAMQIFMKRSLMGKWEDAGKQMGEQFQPHQYTADLNVHHEVERDENLLTDGTATNAISNEKQTRTGEEHVVQKLQDEQLFY